MYTISPLIPSLKNKQNSSVQCDQPQSAPGGQPALQLLSHSRQPCRHCRCLLQRLFQPTWLRGMANHHLVPRKRNHLPGAVLYICIIVLCATYPLLHHNQNQNSCSATHTSWISSPHPRAWCIAAAFHMAARTTPPPPGPRHQSPPQPRDAWALIRAMATWWALCDRCTWPRAAPWWMARLPAAAKHATRQGSHCVARFAATPHPIMIVAIAHCIQGSQRYVLVVGLCSVCMVFTYNPHHATQLLKSKDNSSLPATHSLVALRNNYPLAPCPNLLQGRLVDGTELDVHHMYGGDYQEQCCALCKGEETCVAYHVDLRDMSTPTCTLFSSVKGAVDVGNPAVFAAVPQQLPAAVTAASVP